MVQETEQIGIESLIDDLFDRFGYIAEIYVNLFVSGCIVLIAGFACRLGKIVKSYPHT